MTDKMKQLSKQMSMLNAEKEVAQTFADKISSLLDNGEKTKEKQMYRILEKYRMSYGIVKRKYHVDVYSTYRGVSGIRGKICINQVDDRYRTVGEFLVDVDADTVAINVENSYEDVRVTKLIKKLSSMFNTKDTLNNIGKKYAAAREKLQELLCIYNATKSKITAQIRSIEHELKRLSALEKISIKSVINFKHRSYRKKELHGEYYILKITPKTILLQNTKDYNCSPVRRHTETVLSKIVYGYANILSMDDYVAEAI